MGSGGSEWLAVDDQLTECNSATQAADSSQVSPITTQPNHSLFVLGNAALQFNPPFHNCWLRSVTAHPDPVLIILISLDLT